MSGPQSTRLVFVSEDYVFDPDAQQFSNGSSVLSLGRQEASLLRIIMSANGETVTRHQIEEMLWPDSTQIDVTRRLNTSVSALRRSLRQHTDLDDPIRTVHGEGYRWALNVLEETLRSEQETSLRALEAILQE